MMEKNVYVSSAYQDLKSHREAMHQVLVKIMFKVIAMEDYVARDKRMVELCRPLATSLSLASRSSSSSRTTAALVFASAD